MALSPVIARAMRSASPFSSGPNAGAWLSIQVSMFASGAMLRMLGEHLGFAPGVEAVHVGHRIVFGNVTDVPHETGTGG